VNVGKIIARERYYSGENREKKTNIWDLSVKIL
jgi:hypothetical protein